MCDPRASHSFTETIILSKMETIYLKELCGLSKIMRVNLAMHHKSAIITPPLGESSFYKDEPLFLRPDPTHEVEACKKGCQESRAAEAGLSQPWPPGRFQLLIFLLGKAHFRGYSVATA